MSALGRQATFWGDDHPVGDDVDHHPFCEGHIECTHCGPDSCIRTTTFEPDGRPALVACLWCRGTYRVIPPGGQEA